MLSNEENLRNSTQVTLTGIGMLKIYVTQHERSQNSLSLVLSGLQSDFITMLVGFF